jgi:ribosomal protein L35
MRYGLVITLISAFKLAYKKGGISLFRNYMNGYFKAKKEKMSFLVTEEQGKFIRKLRWKNMVSKQD